MTAIREKPLEIRKSDGTRFSIDSLEIEFLAVRKDVCHSCQLCHLDINYFLSTLQWSDLNPEEVNAYLATVCPEFTWHYPASAMVYPDSCSCQCIPCLVCLESRWHYPAPEMACPDSGSCQCIPCFGMPWIQGKVFPTLHYRA